MRQFSEKYFYSYYMIVLPLSLSYYKILNIKFNHLCSSDPKISTCAMEIGNIDALKCKKPIVCLQGGESSRLV